MANEQPRLRMFAGPNGSGKTTVKKGLTKPRSWFGVDINPDDLERIVKRQGHLNFKKFGLSISQEELRKFFLDSELLQQQNLMPEVNQITFQNDVLDFGALQFNSYFASALSAFLRKKAFEVRKTFTFETVMSANDKVQELHKAQQLGYRTYLYYVATEDPQVNIDRVATRVKQGGHDVPESKIRARYERSLAQLPQAIKNSNRGYFFDTTESEDYWFFAKTTDGTLLELVGNDMPNWFKPIWDQF